LQIGYLYSKRFLFGVTHILNRRAVGELEAEGFMRPFSFEKKKGWGAELRARDNNIANRVFIFKTLSFWG